LLDLPALLLTCFSELSCLGSSRAGVSLGMVLRVTLLLVTLVLLPAVADAVTIRDIIALSKAGLPDDILSAVIDADRTIFTLDAEQILELKRAGVSDAVLLKMVRSRREFDTPPSPPQASAADAPPEVAPEVVIIGGTKSEDERRESRAHEYRGFGVFDGPYYYVPFPLWGTTAPRGHRAPAAPFIAPEQRGFGRFMNDGWIGRR
jgi:hypothetical protein